LYVNGLGVAMRHASLGTRNFETIKHAPGYSEINGGWRICSIECIVSDLRNNQLPRYGATILEAGNEREPLYDLLYRGEE
jgi:hypothetical protein